MWLCNKCGFKNTNSSEKCHGIDCKGMREDHAVELPTSIKKEKEAIFDYCPTCKSMQYFSWAKWKKIVSGWRCHKCLKFYRIKKEKGKKKNLTVPEDTWDGQ